MEEAGRINVEITLNNKLERFWLAALNNCLWYLGVYT
jgi:hypothetical protein